MTKYDAIYIVQQRSNPLSVMATIDAAADKIFSLQGVDADNGKMMEYGTSKRFIVKVTDILNYYIYFSFRAPVCALRGFNYEKGIWVKVDGHCCIGDSIIALAGQCGFRHVPLEFDSILCDGVVTQLDGRPATLFEVIFSELP